MQLRRWGWVGRTVICCMALVGGLTSSNAQTFVGLGLGGGLPTTGYADTSPYMLAGELQYGVHRYCNWWPVATLTYGHFATRDTVSIITPTYPDAFMIQGNLRWFPWGSTTTPLYASLGTGISVVLGDDDESVVGLPGTAEVGYLIHYVDPCCDWFVTLSLRYTASNMLRDLDRPHLSSLSGMIHFNLPLGGGGR
ncbi:MAG: hypothetical protein IPF79_08960 [Ignavibacteria bacterium]|nr:hypothetical protein [Ignavibacteria bacterium]